ncbi:MAG: lactate racemase [Kosmotogales bacterium]|nr:lactate racemase [Kosmotogales bacterium]
MKIKMSYDDPKISEAIISNDVILKEYEPKQASPMTEKELKNKLKNKLEKPIFANSLKSELENKKEILLLSDDNTRTTNVKIIIDTLIELFPEKNFSIIVCLGTHRKMKDEEIEKKFGKKIIDRCKIFQHDWIKATYHDFGTTNSGIPVLINDIIDNYDYIIGTGQVVPHRCTGFSGGTKIMQPGISAGKTTEATHWLSAKYKVNDIMGIRDNPIRKELDEIGIKAGLKFIINVVQDNHHQIVDFFCGDSVEAHRAAAEKTKEIFGFKVEPAEIVISESHPADIELWQASKGIYSAVAAVKPGGTLILVTPCPEGISKTFGKELLKYGYKNTYEEIKKLFESGKISNGILAAHIVHAGEILFKARKVLVVSPGLTEIECKKMGLEKAESLQEAVDKSLKEYSNPRVSVMKFAADLLPILD